MGSGKGNNKRTSLFGRNRQIEKNHNLITYDASNIQPGLTKTIIRKENGRFYDDKIFPKGTILYSYVKDNKRILHNPIGPAITGPHGHEEWWVNGKLHRDADLPAYTTYDYYGGQTRVWFKNGKRHRDGDKPARVLLSPIPGQETAIRTVDENKKSDVKIIKDPTSKDIERYTHVEQYYINGKLHRDDDKPACIYEDKKFNSNNITYYCETYYKNDKKHRDHNKPAEISFFDNEIEKEEHYENGILIPRENIIGTKEHLAKLKQEKAVIRKRKKEEKLIKNIDTNDFIF